MKPVTLELMPVRPQELTRLATDVAGLCKEIVVKTCLEIQGRKYVRVEGWQSIATAHGCVACSRDVEQIYTPDGKTLLGYKAIGEIRRMDGTVIGTAEGFVGADETTWFGGTSRVYDKFKKQYVDKELTKRPDYAIRAMCQTRAISRVCRAAFAHVVVLMDAGLSTTPAEEVPAGGFNDEESRPSPAHHQSPPQSSAPPVTQQPAKAPMKSANPKTPAPSGDVDWKNVRVPFGKNKGTQLGELSEKSLKWYVEEFAVQETYNKDGKTLNTKPEYLAEQQAFRDALDAAAVEYNWSE